MRLEYLSPALWALMAALAYYFLVDAVIIPLFLAPAICEAYLLLLPEYLHTRAIFQYEFPRFVLKLVVVLASVWSLLAWYNPFFFELWFNAWNSTILPSVFSILVAFFAPALLGPHLTPWLTLKPILLGHWAKCHQEVWEEKEAKRLEWVAKNRAGSAARKENYDAAIERRLAFNEGSNDPVRRRRAADERRQRAMQAREEEEEQIRKVRESLREERRQRRIFHPIIDPVPIPPLDAASLDTAPLNTASLDPTEDDVDDEPAAATNGGVTGLVEVLPEVTTVVPVVHVPEPPIHRSLDTVIQPAEPLVSDPVVLDSEPEGPQEPTTSDMVTSTVTETPIDTSTGTYTEPTQAEAIRAALTIQLSLYIYDCIEAQLKGRFGDLLIEPEVAAYIVRAIEIATETWDESIGAAIAIATRVVEDLETKLTELTGGQDGDSSSDDDDEEEEEDDDDDDYNADDDAVYGPPDYGSSLSDSSDDSVHDNVDDHDDNNDAVNGPSDHGSSIGDLSDDNILDGAAQDFSNTCNDYDTHDDDEMVQDHSDESSDLFVSEPAGVADDDVSSDLLSSVGDLFGDDEYAAAPGTLDPGDPTYNVSGADIDSSDDDFVLSRNSDESESDSGEGKDLALSDLFSPEGDFDEDEYAAAPGIWDFRDSASEFSDSESDSSDDSASSCDSDESEDDFMEDDCDDLSALGHCIASLSIEDVEQQQQAITLKLDEAILDALSAAVSGPNATAQMLPPFDLPAVESADAPMPGTGATTNLNTNLNTNVLPQMSYPVRHVLGLTLPAIESVDASMIDTPASIVPDTNAFVQVPMPIPHVHGLTFPAVESADATMGDTPPADAVDITVAAEMPIAAGSASLDGMPVTTTLDTTAAAPPTVFLQGSESVALTSQEEVSSDEEGIEFEDVVLTISQQPSQDLEFNSAQYLRTVRGWTEDEIFMDCEIAALFRADEERQAQNQSDAWNPFESQDSSEDQNRFQGWNPSQPQSFEFDLGAVGELPMPSQPPTRKISAKPKGRLEKVGAERLQQMHAEAKDVPLRSPSSFDRLSLDFNTPITTDTSTDQPSEPIRFSPISQHTTEGAFEAVQVVPPEDNKPTHGEESGMRNRIADDANTADAVEIVEELATAPPAGPYDSGVSLANAVVGELVDRFLAENPDLEDGPEPTTTAPEPMIAAEPSTEPSPEPVPEPVAQPITPARRSVNLDEAAPPEVINPAMLVAPSTPSPYSAILTPSPQQSAQTPASSTASRPRVEPGSLGKAPPRKSANTSNPLMSRSFKQRKKKQ